MDLATIPPGVSVWRPEAHPRSGDSVLPGGRSAKTPPERIRWLRGRDGGARLIMPQRKGAITWMPLAEQPGSTWTHKAMRMIGAMVRQPMLVGETLAFVHARDHQLMLSPWRCFLKPFRPFVCAGWSPSTKLQRMRQHFRLADNLGGIMRPTRGPPRMLAILPLMGASYRVTIDEPRIMLDDGLAVLSLWQDERRLFSISFLLSQRDGQPLVALIGGIQGRAEDGVLDTYRALTKAAFGLRPRDLLIEVFQTLCRGLGVGRILAIGDAATYHSDPYFGDRPMDVVRLNYDTVWRDRGAQRVCEQWYELPVVPKRRAEGDIPPRKRALYRRRYALIDAIYAAVAEAVRDAVPGAA